VPDPHAPESNQVAALRPLVQRYLAEAFGAYDTDNEGDYVVPFRSARVYILPRDWTAVPDFRTGEERRYTLVLVRAWTNVGMRAGPELAQFITAENHGLLFGKLCLDPTPPSVYVEHVLLGDYLNFDELAVAVACVAHEADHYGDTIVARFGGRRFTDT